MYGYIRPLKAELKVREYEAYHAMYCGLCRTLGRRYGFAARFLVSYDLTFLCCLLEGGAEQWRQGTCFCPANPLCRKHCVEQSEAMAHAADLTVLLAWQKLRDAVQDEHGPKRIAAWLGTRLYGRAYRRAAARLPEQAARIERQLGRLAALEAAQSASLDETADAFARILAGCAALLPEGAPRRAGEQLLYHTGRFIYLTDALDDAAEDARRGRYNPALRRYQAGPEGLCAADRASLTETIDASVSLAGAAMELMPLRAGRGIVGNIVYQGMPGVLRAVAAGTFRNKKRADRSHL